MDNRPWHKLTWSKAPGEIMTNGMYMQILKIYKNLTISIEYYISGMALRINHIIEVIISS